jgi:hypothetical protein
LVGSKHTPKEIRERAFCAIRWLTAANGVFATYNADIVSLVPILVKVIVRTSLDSNPAVLSILVDCCHSMVNLMDSEYPENSVVQVVVANTLLLPKVVQMCLISAALREASLVFLHSVCYNASNIQLEEIIKTSILNTLQTLVAHTISQTVSAAVLAVVAEICAGSNEVLLAVDESRLTVSILKLAKNPSSSQGVMDAAALAIMYYFYTSNKPQTYNLLSNGAMKIVVDQLDIAKPVLALEALKVLKVLLSTTKFQTKKDFDRVIGVMDREGAWTRLTALATSSSASSSSSSSSSPDEHGDIRQLAQDLMDKDGLSAAMTAFEKAEESQRARKKTKRT